MENNGLPNYLKEFITNENHKYLNTQLIHSTRIDKHITSHLSLTELDDYKKDMKIGESYFYCELRPLAYSNNISLYTNKYIHKDLYRL
jgi:hypothetical protein